MAGGGPPSTPYLLASAKSWMPTFVGMTTCKAAEESIIQRAGITACNMSVCALRRRQDCAARGTLALVASRLDLSREAGELI